MKVLHVIPFLSGSCGGPVQAVTQLCQELRNQGVETAIATTTIDQDKTRVIPDFVPVYSFGRQFCSILPSEFAFSLGLKHWLKRRSGEFDLLHIHYLFTYPSAVACHYARKYKIPYIIRPAGMLDSFSLSKSALRKKIYIFLLEKKNLCRASAVHFTSSEEMCQAERLRLGYQSALVPLGLNLERFINLGPLKGEFRKRYPQTINKKIILFLSRLDPKKGLDILIAALKILAVKRDDFIFVLAGSGDKNYEKFLSRALVSAGLTEICVLTGFLEGSEKSALLADADVFVLPSYDENFGMAVVEAMAARLAVIISNRVNIHKLIEDYRAGIVTGLNAGEIAFAIERIISDERLRLEMGAQGERLVEENFNVKKIARQMIAVYSQYLRPGDVS